MKELEEYINKDIHPAFRQYAKQMFYKQLPDWMKDD